jgi:hypothetical protein
MGDPEEGHELRRPSLEMCLTGGRKLKGGWSLFRPEEESMFRLPSLQLVFSLSALALAACGENESPTQPGTGVEALPGAPLAALTSNTWTERAAYPAVFGAVGLSAGSVPIAAGQSLVYTFGGTDDMGGSCVSIGAYNVATNNWTGLGFGNQLCLFDMNGVGRIGTTLYFSGGRVHGGDGVLIDRTAWAFDASSNSLTKKADMPRGTARGVTGAIDGKIYVLPGICSTDFWPSPGYCEQEPFRRLFRYNPATNFWVWRAPAPHYHINGAGGVINGKFYVAGGAENERALDVYDPATDTWKTLAPLPVGGRAIGTVLRGKLFVIVANLAYAYNPATNTWSAKAAPKYPHPAVVNVTVNGLPALFAVGGIHWAPNAIPNPSELYTP